ncbi:protein SPIRAL1-like 2 [Wolffia australiana]
MGRGVSSGGGQSSLGYLFGSEEQSPKPRPAEAENQVIAQKPATPPAPIKEIPAGIQGNNVNNYFRAEGQNTGNFITDRPSTKVHAAPGGGSSLGYLFGDGGK